METTIVYWGNIGIMEKKMETTIVDIELNILPLLRNGPLRFQATHWTLLSSGSLATVGLCYSRAAWWESPNSGSCLAVNWE